MGMTPEQLKEWSKKNNKFVKVEEDDPFFGRLIDAKPITKDVNGETKEVIRFYFEPSDGGNDKTWDTQNGKIIEQMSAYLGKLVKISCEGQGNKKRYTIEMARAITPDQIPDEAVGVN